MPDILIRDVPEQVIASIDARAARLGISRSEYIRRRWIQDVVRGAEEVSVADFASFAVTFQDLSDPEVMSRAWR